MKTKEQPKRWIVRMRCVIIKEVCLSPCTREQAERSPWEFAEDEQETDQHDWTVLSLEENV